MRNHRAYLHQAVANEARNFHDLWETTHTNARNNNTIYYTDAFGNTIRIDEKNGSSTYSTDYDYNVMGELVKVTDDADNVTDIEYDRAGRKTEMTDPDMGEWAYTYDPGGNLKTQTDARSKVLWFDYDAINRLKEVRDTGSTGTRLVTRSYDPTGHKGYPAAATSHTPKGDVVVTYDTYDTRHRLTRQEWDIPGDAGGDFTQTWTYNNDNTIATTRYPAGPDGSLGETTTYTHSSTHGMLTKIEGDETIASSIDYNSFGAVSDWVTGTTDTVTREVLYDDQRRPKQWKATRDSDSKNLLNLTNAAYDDNNNLERLTDLSGGNTTEWTNYGQRLCYDYDDLDRLTNAHTSDADSCTVNTSIGIGGFDHDYTYDTIGNLTSNDYVSTTNNYTYAAGSAGPHAVTSIGSGYTFGYDANGNMDSRTTPTNTQTLAWNTQNRLWKVTQGSDVNEYIYDADGNRVATYHPDGNQTVYIGDIAKFDTTTTGGTATPTLIAATASTHQSDATPTITLPSGVMADDVIVMHVGSKQANSAFVSDWDGFTEIHQGTYDNHATSIAYIVATGSDTNPEITVVDEWAEAIVTIQVWRNVDTTDPIDADQGSADSSANNTDFTLSGITTTVDDAVIVAFGYGKPSGATFTPPSGWTEDTDHQSTNRTSTSAHTTQATQGATGTVTFTRSASSNIGTGSVIALTPATTSGGTGTPTLIAASASTHQGDATPTITLPTGIQADDVIVMHVGSKQANSAFVSDWDGFTEIHQGTYDNHATSIAYKVASGSDTDPEITVVDQWAEAIVTIQVWRGIDTTNPIDADQGSADSSANNTDYTLTGITTTTNNAAIVAFAYGKPAGVTFTPPSGWTEDTDKASTNRSETSAHTIQTNPGTTGNITFTRSSPSDTGAGSVIALTPTPAVTIEGTFYYFHNGALAGQTTNNIFTHVLTDHQGTPHTTWTPDTGETNRRLHQTWGSVRHDDGLDNTHSYTAQDQDPTALMHYNARNYDPTIGRFISPDTIIPNPTNPQDFNRYSYVGNNPTNYTDPTGHDPDESYLCPGVMYECTKDVKTFSVGLWDSWAKNHPGYGHRRADELVRSSDSISEYARFSLGFVLGTLDPVIAAGAGAARLLADRATEASAALRNGERWGGKWLSDIQRIRGVVAIGRAVRDIRVIKAATRTAPYVGMGLIVYDNYQEDQSLARTGVESAVEIAVDLSITLIVGVACSTVVGCLVAVPGGVAVATVLAPALGEWIADYFVGPQP